MIKTEFLCDMCGGPCSSKTFILPYSTERSITRRGRKAMAMDILQKTEMNLCMDCQYKISHFLHSLKEYREAENSANAAAKAAEDGINCAT